MTSLFNVPQLLSEYGYIGIFVIIFIESGVFFALPGDSLLFTAGLFAASGVLSVYILLPLAFIATFLGGIAGYGIGKYLDRIHRYAFFRKILKEEYITEAHVFFDKHGRAAILISRFAPVLRTFTPIVAGVARMEKGAYIRYNALSSLIWSLVITLLGFYLGKAFPQITNYLDYFVIGIVVVSLLPVFIGWLRRRSRKSDTR